MVVFAGFTRRQRGNAILVSAIFVFALTMAAIGVSRMLVNQAQQRDSERLFLGTQASAFCEAALTVWLQNAANAPGAKPGTIFPSNTATYTVEALLPLAAAASLSGTASVLPESIGLDTSGWNKHRFTVNGSVTDRTQGWTASRRLAIELVPADDTSWSTRSSTGSRLVSVGGGL
ncbi:MAG: hypothetical protein HY692_05130 [Cyanobacteria bacterium NC_groundwater_1444_Ag_S-0.65um_54_12]|nr:hypothetical protein [Cyanobacteria bacterium NC_groundwater_1444_Ag_S-0.65um_54_12]